MTDLVYFLRATTGDGPIKIGSSWKPAERLATFMAWSPQPLEIILTIPGDLELERRIHNCFADAHSHSEWFHPSERLLAAIDAMKAGTPVQWAIDLNKPTGNVLGLTQAATRRRNGTSGARRGKPADRGAA